MGSAIFVQMPRATKVCGLQNNTDRQYTIVLSQDLQSCCHEGNQGIGGSGRLTEDSKKLPTASLRFRRRSVATESAMPPLMVSSQTRGGRLENHMGGSGSVS